MSLKKSTSLAANNTSKIHDSIDWFYGAELPDGLDRLIPENALGQSDDGSLFIAQEDRGEIKEDTIKPIELSDAVNWMINVQKVNIGSRGTGIELLEMIREFMRKLSLA